ncbi:MAG: hypothetical protein JWM56_199 [Candidatus Peribacteria bacterium]|nr:hypothetical protein [Candidatus Peribacteria bacterium]
MQLFFPLRSAFVALPLEGDALRTFIAIQNTLTGFADFLRLQNPGSPHLTLYFWKELMEIEYYQVTAQLQKIADHTPPFTIHVTGADVFGHKGQDRVLYLTIGFSEELARLKKSCPWPNIARNNSASLPTHIFYPHSTLARIHHPDRFAVHKKKIMKLLSDVSFNIPANRLRLYAEVDNRKQTPLQDYMLHSSVSS